MAAQESDGTAFVRNNDFLKQEQKESCLAAKRQVYLYSTIPTQGNS